MLFSNKIIVFVIILLCCQLSFSQDKTTQKDSSAVLTSVLTTPKNKTAKFFHRLIFKPAKSKKVSKKIIVPKHLKVEGKIIRNIIITTLDPFGYSEIDTNRIPTQWSEKTGNWAHLKSKRISIKNMLLFSKNKPYSLLEIKESERILRSQNFINRVSITEKLTAPKSDSVDVFVRVLDSWSSIPKFNISNSKTGLGLKERNFFGLGHQLDYYYSNRKSDGKDANNMSYLIPNIKNTFIRTEFKYSVDFDRYYSKGITIERPFYSPLSKWAAGIALNQNYLKDSIQDVDETYISQNFKYSTHDFWGGRAFRIIKADTITERTTNLIVSARFLNMDYLIKPSETLDPIHFYDTEKLLLTGIGINTRQFVEDRYIFKNGQTEDVPIGRIYGITGGYQYKNSKWRPYFGAQISFGNYHPWGFLSTNFEIGSFFKQSKTEQSAISFQANYFTNLIEIGNWKFRQFIKPQVIIGFNREKSLGDLLTINENNGIQGFNSPVYGTQKMILTLQTQSYSPKAIWGFRFNPYFNYTLAILGNKNNQIHTNKTYSKIGIGVLINNDFLVFSAFQLSLAYYPKIPFQGDNIFKTNAFETTDFGFQNFELAKPKIVPFK
ncbi:hypothetical protein EOD40_12140 [Flavobacterium sufflavum]|uniref:Uncharacterized protein n=1 Tax=Flavobacterium sufflavum TaxID=1921138 RepID=A0A437KSB3_9FLAO|nr:hypothetical protein [Flavobacterium sufflavum]RVT74916.1 hypothetical protein EOD40_12140 [Flavobacterium sufflavum]